MAAMGTPRSCFCFFLLLLGGAELKPFQRTEDLPSPSLGAAVCLHAPHLGSVGPPVPPPPHFVTLRSHAVQSEPRAELTQR